MSSGSADTPFDRGRPLVDHLAELRRRLLWCVGGVVGLSIPAWGVSVRLIDRMAAITGPLVFLSPTEAFASRIKLTLIVALVLGAPLVLYHGWRYVGVALTVSERRVALGALPASFLLFVSGAAAGWFWIAPTGLKFLMGFASPTVRPTLSVEACVAFALWTSLGLGLLFQLPVVVGALAHWGFVRAATLAHYRRQACLAILVVSAVLTPGPDIFSQLLLAAPTYALYELSVVVARVLEP